LAADTWNRQSLTRQFVYATSPVLLAGMVVIGQWVTQRIEEVVINSYAVTAALYTDSFIEPRLQALATDAPLPDEAKRALDELLLPQAAGEPVVGFRIWRGDTIVYSDRAELIGQSFPPSEKRDLAWSGRVTADYGHLEPAHGSLQAAVEEPLLEIYAPVHEPGTGRIIALAETYQLAPDISGDLARARIGSWMMVGGVTLAMMVLQVLIVGKGNRTILSQRLALRERIDQLSRLLRENEVLRRRSTDTSRRVSEMNEAFLRRVGSDLHDGPVQILGSAVLRLDALGGAVDAGEPDILLQAREDLAVVRDALREALTEIRNLSSGLAPPDVEDLPLPAVFRLAVQRHRRRTGTEVLCTLGPLPEETPLAYRSCFYRFVQEGLANAFRHAGGRGQAVSAAIEGDDLVARVEDAGPGMDRVGESGGLGLAGLRDRIEALGGELRVGARPGGGTVLTARFGCRQLGLEHGHG